MTAKNLGDLLRQSCAAYADRPAMMVPAKVGFETIVYRELCPIVRRYAAAVDSLALKKGDRLAIQSENCPEWAFVDWACQTLGVVVVPIYPTLPADQTQHIVRDSGAAVAIAGSEEQAAKLRPVEALRVVMLRDGQESLSAMAAEEMDEAEWNRRIDQVGAEDLATIIYTSGTTGLPKGAMLPHRSFVHLCEAAVSSLPINDQDVFLSFLPMSHIFERMAGQFLPISCGACIAFSKSLMTLANDMVAARPTVMLCVPRFLEATQQKILDGVAKQPPMKQRLFKWALAQGKAKARGGFAPFAGLLDSLVGKKIREKTGGRIRFFVSGGAALPGHVADFYQAFGLKVLQGYGLTETCAATCVNHPDRNRPETVGEPLAGMEVRIADDGEILIRGPGVMHGYYNMPEETAAAIDAEGWFHSGDIGRMDGRSLIITDRKKDLLVLGNGKNVAPQPIENRLRESPFIQEAVVLGDGMEHCVALIVPAPDAVRTELGLGENGALAENPEVRKLIKAEIDRINKGLANFEMVKNHALLERPFSIEEGELTPTLKVKRKVVKERYADKIAGLWR